MISSALRELGAKIDDRTARIGVIGLGYVGLPLAVELRLPASRLWDSTSTRRRFRRLKPETHISATFPARSFALLVRPID